MAERSDDEFITVGQGKGRHVIHKSMMDDGVRKNYGENQSKQKQSRAKRRRQVHLSRQEHGMVIGELNTYYYRRYEGKHTVRTSIGNYTYTVAINGFNDYEIIKKEAIRNRKRKRKQ